jgi:hypothetical protein
MGSVAVLNVYLILVSVVRNTLEANVCVQRIHSFNNAFNSVASLPLCLRLRAA